ncbi:AbrB family transcriptional regulator [[Bacillus] sp. KCTC 13219]|nr:AbrB family transcriptional regulator [[Bacillus] sp. KCTC 13219]
MQFNKKMSKAGSITLPAALRRAIGVEAGEKFSVNLQGDGSVLLKRTQGNCLLCNAEEELITHNGRLVCKSCIDTLQTKAGEGA